jgi:hypothetical protein
MSPRRPGKNRTVDIVAIIAALGGILAAMGLAIRMEERSPR